MTYAFVLDASACTGCKACQAACKDKNGLPLGVLWRRVYEVTGGGWKQEGAAWTNTVFAYNLSMACNHCEHPKCAGVCPVDAYTVREDGIVILDSSKCMGCGYCAWACPYEAPQYDRAAGYMTKCNFCYDNLDAGVAPACVAACPLRVLDYAEVDDGQASAGGRLALWEAPGETHPFPLPADSRTQPHLAIKPHAAMKSEEAKRTANYEEVHPRKETGWEEAPLVMFTLLAQMAVGGFWAMLWLLGEVRLVPMLLIGLCLGTGMVASFAHLGTKRNAWRALNHLRKSWLSRELLFTLLFGAGWLAALASSTLHLDIPIVEAVTALLGLGLVHCMSRVYRLRAVPPWDTWRTETRFFVSAGMLGILGISAAAAWTGLPFDRTQAGVATLILLSAQAAMAGGLGVPAGMRRLHMGLIIASVAGCAAVFLIPGWLTPASGSVLSVVVMAEEGLGRLLFYRARTGR